LRTRERERGREREREREREKERERERPLLGGSWRLTDGKSKKGSIDDL
jgi:hypothetical protein